MRRNRLGIGITSGLRLWLGIRRVVLEFVD